MGDIFARGTDLLHTVNLTRRSDLPYPPLSEVMEGSAKRVFECDRPRCKFYIDHSGGTHSGVQRLIDEHLAAHPPRAPKKRGAR